MNPYNPKAKCPKCGHGKVSSCHMAAGEGFYLREVFRNDKERIDRTCLRCHFDWSESPIKKENRGRRRPVTTKAGETERATVRKSRQQASSENLGPRNQSIVVLPIHRRTSRVTSTDREGK